MRLNDFKVVAVIAVSDISKAKEFYESKLGLTGGEGMGDGAILYRGSEGTSFTSMPLPTPAHPRRAALVGRSTTSTRPSAS